MRLRSQVGKPSAVSRTVPMFEEKQVVKTEKPPKDVFDVTDAEVQAVKEKATPPAVVKAAKEVAKSPKEEAAMAVVQSISAEVNQVFSHDVDDIGAVLDADPFALPPDEQPTRDYKHPEPPVETTKHESAKEEVKAEKPVAVKAATSPELQRIIESVFEIDLGSAWKRIHEALQPTKGGSSARDQLRIIDDRSREASKIYAALKLEYERYKLDCEFKAATTRTKVVAILQAEKESGQGKKQVTEADIRSKTLELYPEEVKEQELSLRKYSLAVEHAERMVDVLRQKSRSLNTEVGRGFGGPVED